MQRVQLFARRIFPRAISGGRSGTGNAGDRVARSQWRLRRATIFRRCAGAQCPANHWGELSMEDGSILPVLVENRTGYKNLCELLTQAHLRSEKGKCAVSWDEPPAIRRRISGASGERTLAVCWFRHSAETFF